MASKYIYIVTLNSNRNYGTLLQATALCKYLEGKGYVVSILTHWHVTGWLIRHPSLILSRIKNKFNTKEREKFFTPSDYDISEERNHRINVYKEEELHFVRITDKEQWRKALEEKAIFIAGSDIIWQPANGYPSKFFLDFVYHTDLNRFSYASSFGATDLPHSYFKAYKKYLSKFSGVSVREESSADMLQNIIGKEVYKVVDPTMLLPKNTWDIFAKKAKFSFEIPERYILCYFVMNDDRYWEYMENVTEVADLPVVVLPMHKIDEEQPYKFISDGTPYEFIYLIKNAEFICTDSLHACVFSTIYEKEFYLLRRKREAENVKYNDFFHRYGLSSRIIEDESIFERNLYTDFSLARQLIERDRKFSIQYLDNCLNMEKF